MPPRPKLEALNLPRLAAATPDKPVNLPDGAYLALHLSAPQQGGEAARWYVCLSGELILDLPHGEFVHLKSGEAYRVPEGQARTLTPLGTASVLVLP